MKHNSKKGFTIVELLAVVVVIAIIIVIATASIFSLMKQAREKQYETNLDSMGSATRLFGDDAKNGLSKINNALVYKDKNGKTWKIGCKAEGLSKKCCVNMAMLRDMGYLKITEQDMCGDNKPCLNYNANLTYSGNSLIVDLTENVENCEIIKYKVSYHSVEKINSGEELTLEQLCEYNKPCLLKISPPEFRAKYPGHKVINWEDRRGYIYETGKEVDLTSRTTTDVFDLFANWKNNEFTFTYHGNTSNAGTMTPSHHTYEDGSSLKPNVYTKIGYSYLYWNDKANGSGRKYDDMEHVSANDFDDGTNIDIYAQWKPNDYNVTFDANNGSNLSFSSKVVTFDSPYGDLPTVSRIGYTFKGWWTAKTGGSEIKTTTIVKTPDHHTLYARWQANKYTVTFNANGGGTPNPKTKTVTYDSTYGTLASVTREGYSFTGWYTAASGGTKIEATTKVQITANQTLYAHWVDDIKPTITCAKSHTGETGGLTATCTCSDAGTGIVSCAGKTVTATSSTTETKTGLKTSQTYTVKDSAGNTNSTTVTVTAQAQTRTKSCSTAKRCTSAGCETWKNCTHSECGVQSYKTCRTSGCGCATYKRCSAAGCEKRNSCANSACGCKEYNKVNKSKCYMGSAGCRNSCPGACDEVGGSCKVQCTWTETGTCKTYNSCVNSSCSCQTYNRGSSCGCETWNSCAHSECGVQSYKTCRTSGCGCETYKRNASKCGCETWGSWGSWTNASSCSAGESSDHGTTRECRTVYN